MNKRKMRMVALVLAAGLSGAAQAELQGRDLNGSIDSFEAYYDTDLNITWLADANYAQTSGYDADGLMDWVAANAWAANLSFTDGINVYDNWRLPTTQQPDASCGSQSNSDSFGYGCTGSEMGHLFYSELGGTAGESILTSTDPDLAKLTNLQASSYWFAQEYTQYTVDAWYFNFGYGNQNAYPKGFAYYTLAVTFGDAAAVPEAETYAMILAGLGLVGAAARRRRG